MKRIHLIGVSFLVAGLLVGCGSSDGDSSGENPFGGSTGAGTGVSAVVTPVTTVEEAEQAVAAFSAINSMGAIGSNFAQNAPSRAPNRSVISLAPINQSTPCSNGGTMSIKGDADQSGNMNVVTKFANCNQQGTVMNGGYDINSQTSGSNVHMDMEMSNFSYSSAASGNMTMNLRMTIDTNLQYNPMDLTMDGTIVYDIAGNSGKVGYSNFKVRTQNSALNMSGTISMESSQYSCYNGTYNVTTLEDLRTSYGSGYSSGVMVINGATYSYNSDSTVTVTLPNGETSVINQNTASVCH